MGRCPMADRMMPRRTGSGARRPQGGQPLPDAGRRMRLRDAAAAGNGPAPGATAPTTSFPQYDDRPATVASSPRPDTARHPVVPAAGLPQRRLRRCSAAPGAGPDQPAGPAGTGPASGSDPSRHGRIGHDRTEMRIRRTCRNAPPAAGRRRACRRPDRATAPPPMPPGHGRPVPAAHPAVRRYPAAPAGPGIGRRHARAWVGPAPAAAVAGRRAAGRPAAADVPAAPVRQRLRPGRGGPPVRRHHGDHLRPRPAGRATPSSIRTTSTWCPAVTSRPRSTRRSARSGTCCAVGDGGSGVTGPQRQSAPTPGVGALCVVSAACLRSLPHRVGATPNHFLSPLRRCTQSVTMIASDRRPRCRSARCPRRGPGGCRSTSATARR